jgi:hypothetical protein
VESNSPGLRVASRPRGEGIGRVSGTGVVLGWDDRPDRHEERKRERERKGRHSRPHSHSLACCSDASGNSSSTSF